LFGRKENSEKNKLSHFDYLLLLSQGEDGSGGVVREVDNQQLRLTGLEKC
jgi:hypothetical protein